MPSIRWLLPQNKSLPFPLRRKKEAVLYIIGAHLEEADDPPPSPFLVSLLFLIRRDSRDKKGGFTSLLGFPILLFLWEDFSSLSIWEEKFARWSKKYCMKNFSECVFVYI